MIYILKLNLHLLVDFDIEKLSGILTCNDNIQWTYVCIPTTTTTSTTTTAAAIIITTTTTTTTTTTSCPRFLSC